MNSGSQQTGKKILTELEYYLITTFISQYNGLAIDCELELQQKFPDIYRMALKSILSTQTSYKMRNLKWRNKDIGQKYLQAFEDNVAANHYEPTLLLKMANLEGITPISLCRAILQEKYQSKVKMSRMIKYPYLIDDPKLSANVIQCVCSDNQMGPLVDLYSRFLGEEYEFKLKQLAKAAGMHYHDENDLRRLGYDKTPDIKLILPFLYKGDVINWIESKAIFGDVKTHKHYINQQLNSYRNRFGPGIIIYWFGYHVDILALPKDDENVGITVLADFPAAEHITLLNIEKAMEEQPNTSTAQQ